MVGILASTFFRCILTTQNYLTELTFFAIIGMDIYRNIMEGLSLQSEELEEGYELSDQGTDAISASSLDQQGNVTKGHFGIPPALTKLLAEDELASLGELLVSGYFTKDERGDLFKSLEDSQSIPQALKYVYEKAPEERKLVFIALNLQGFVETHIAEILEIRDEIGGQLGVFIESEADLVNLEQNEQLEGRMPSNVFSFRQRFPRLVETLETIGINPLPIVMKLIENPEKYTDALVKVIKDIMTLRADASSKINSVFTSTDLAPVKLMRENSENFSKEA